MRTKECAPRSAKRGVSTLLGKPNFRTSRRAIKGWLGGVGFLAIWGTITVPEVTNWVDIYFFFDQKNIRKGKGGVDWFVVCERNPF